MCLVPSKGKHVTSGASAGKHETNMLSLCYRMGPRHVHVFSKFSQNLRKRGKAENFATSTKRGKACKQYQARENIYQVLSAGKHVSCTK